MNELITILVPLFCFVFVIAFILLNQRFEKDKMEAEKERFREFVKAIKSKTLIDYQDSTEEEKELPVEKEDEFVDVENVEEERLIKSLNKN